MGTHLTKMQSRSNPDAQLFSILAESAQVYRKQGTCNGIREHAAARRKQRLTFTFRISEELAPLEFLNSLVRLSHRSDRPPPQATWQAETADQGEQKILSFGQTGSDQQYPNEDRRHQPADKGPPGYGQPVRAEHQRSDGESQGEADDKRCP
jgi:hypothetical protein